MDTKIYLVTGSTLGIGKATAERLLQSGAQVIFNSPDATFAGIAAYGDKATFIQADISQTRDIERLRDEIQTRFGRLDGLVANAGIMPLPAGISNITDANIDRTIDVNLKGTFQCLRILGPCIQATSPKGAIVVVTSVDGIIGEPYGVIYSATKAGLISLTKSFARYFNSPLVRVNAVAPGLINTPLTAGSGEDPAATTEASVIKRVGEPEEVASAIAYLLSDDASYITGQVVAVDGGFTLK